MERLKNNVEEFVTIHQLILDKETELESIENEINNLSKIDNFDITFEEYARKNQLMEYQRVIEEAIFQKGKIHFSIEDWARDCITEHVEGLEDNARLKAAWSSFENAYNSNGVDDLRNSYKEIFDEENNLIKAQRDEALSLLEQYIGERSFNGLYKLLTRYEPRAIDERSLKQVVEYERECLSSGVMNVRLKRNYIQMKYAVSGQYICGRFDIPFNQGFIG